MASEDLTIVDDLLFKVIGLHQILNPTIGRNWRYIIALVACAVLMFIVQVVQVVGFYFTLNDLYRFTFTTTVVSTCFLCLFKVYVMVTNADRLRVILDVARYEFTSASSRDQRTVRRSRATLSTILRTFTALSYITSLIWLLGPLSKMNDYLPIKDSDGTVSRYRVTIYNIWLPVPVTVYNAPAVWALIYAVEVVICFMNVVFWIMFDSYVMTMCFTFNAQFRTLADGFATIGHRHAKDAHIIQSDKNYKLHCYNELINHIRDNQKIMKKYDEFFDVMGFGILFQIISGSYTVITLIFLTSLTYLMGFSLLSEPVLKAFFGFLSITFQLFLYCYVFNHLETGKSSVNFGLYCSNWTAMDLKFKKILLMAMSMNSAHRRAMKVSQKSIVNLEMFANIMNMSYSIVSVLLNSRTTK